MTSARGGHRERQIRAAADIAISARLYPNGAVTSQDVKTAAVDHFGLTITDTEAVTTLRERLDCRGWNSNGTGFKGEEPTDAEQ